MGDNGAEFTDIRKGDIVFNHKQTEEIFKNGYVTSNGGRGNIANANGNAYLEGNAYSIGVSGSFTTAGSLDGANKFYNDALTFGGNGNGDSEDEFRELMDWVEIMIDRLERKIDDLDTVAGSAYNNFTKRNQTLAEEFGKVTEEIELQQKAYNTYMAKAESIDLDPEYKTKIQDGKLQIEDITDEKLKEKIDDYQEWYEKALDCSYAITDLNEQLGDLTKAKFDNISAEFEALRAEIEDSIEMVETGLDIVEAKGNFASKTYYTTLMSTEKENIAMLEKQYVALQQGFADAMATGKIEEGSEAYYDMQQQIRDVAKSLQEADLALIEYKNDMWEMDWSAFEYGQSLIEELTKESEFLIDLLSFNENDLFSKVNGKLTDSGFAVAGLRAVNYNTYMAQAEEYEKKMKEVNAELAKDPTNTILIDKKNEYLEAQREAINNANSEKMAIHDLIEESYNKMLEILQELIDKRKEALDAEKSLYDYERQVAEQTKQIASYQKQLTALSGDDSEESKSKRQQLQTSLEEAQKDLESSEYDRWIDDQEKLLTNMYDQYSEILTERLDNIDGLLGEVIAYTNANGAILSANGTKLDANNEAINANSAILSANGEILSANGEKLGANGEAINSNGLILGENTKSINETLQGVADAVGYEFSEHMSEIWSPDSGVKDIVSEFNGGFATTLTKTNDYIQKIHDLINQSVKKSEEEIKENTQPAADIVVPKPEPAPTPTPVPTPTPTPAPSTSTSTSGSKFKHSFFKYKKDDYPKSKLNINASVIDRLKYNDINPAWDYMKQYYAGMGLGSASSYAGSYAQNVAMLNWMKKNGYSTGGTIGKLINASGEDGFVLAKEGEHILNKEQLSIASAMVDKLLDFSKLQANTNAIKGASYVNNSENNISMNISLPSVTNYDEFVTQLQKDKRFEKIVQSMTVEQSLGKNSLNKFKHK